jgi:chloride channel protein, CIC family
MRARRQRLKDALLEAAGAFREKQLLLLDTLLLGVVGALSAQLFLFLLRAAQTFFLNWLADYQPPGLPNEGGISQQVIGVHGFWFIPLATTLGGLISGILIYSLAPEAEGHGTDSAIKAFHQAAGFLRARVPPLKMIASAITIGSGGAGGREGPTALISAGFGSVYATLTHRSEEDRQLLVLIGMAAGLSAIFRSPIGTAIFAVEVLYGGMDFEMGALIYTTLASIVAYAVNGLFVGWEPLFRVSQNLPPPAFVDYAWYIVLGVAAGLVATLLPLVFYSVRDAFRVLPLPPHLKPAIGGLGVGLIALELPQVLAGGYGWIQLAIDGKLSAELLLILVFAEMIAFALTIGSGGSGGVFAPTLFVGAMLGGFLAKVLNLPSAGLVVVGMAAVFGGAARVPMATLLMVTEMTGGYRLLVPAALAVMLSFLIQGALSSRLKYKTLYEMQVASRAESPAHNVDYLEVALRLLEGRRISVPPNIDHLNLRKLLASGIPVDLPGGKQLLIGILNAKSPCQGKPIESCFSLDHGTEVETVAVFREEHTLLPHPGLKLQAGDRLLLIATPQGREKAAQHLAKLTPAASPR